MVIPYITIDANKKVVQITTNIITYCCCEFVFGKNIAYKFLIH